MALAAPLTWADDPFPGTIAFTYGDQEPASLADYMGCFQRAQYMAGIQLADPSFVGMKVVGIKVPFLHADPCTDPTAWIATNASFTDQPDVCNESVEIVDNTITHRFAEPYTITSTDTYVGYGLTVEELNDLNVAPIPMNMEPGSAMVRIKMLDQDYLGWDDYSSFASCVMVVYLEGELPANRLAVAGSVDNPIVMHDEAYSIALPVSNGGSNAVQSIDYTFTYAGGPNYSKTLTFDTPIEPVLGGISTINLDLDGERVAGQRNCTVTIDKVNGEPNSSADNKAEFLLSVLDYKPAHQALMEEATGTWCGWCPRGWIAMREMNKLHPDFIGVAYHNGDVMTVTENYPFNVSGFPGASLDRGPECDPYMGYSGGPFGIEADYLAACQKATLGDIQLETKWVGDGYNEIEATATVKFALPINSDAYRVGYLLVGNGYCDPQDPSWEQSNYYSGGTGYTGLEAELAAMPNPVPDMTFDDVVINVSAMNGVGGSLPEKMATGTEYTHTYHYFDVQSTQSMYDTPLACSPGDYEVVAFIVDKQGHVFNAAKSRPGGSAIHDVDFGTMAGQPAWYDLTGNRLANPGHGIFIKVQDGKATKVRL